MELTLEITKADIAAAQSKRDSFTTVKSQNWCPIAQSIRRAFPGLLQVLVLGSGIVQLTDTSSHTVEYGLDATGCTLIANFDRGRTVRPCTVTAQLAYTPPRRLYGVNL